MRRCYKCMQEYQDSLDRCPECHYKEGTQEWNPRFLKEGTILQGRYIVGICMLLRDCDNTYIGWDAMFDRRVLIQEFYPEWYAARHSGGEVQIVPGQKLFHEQCLNEFENYHKKLIYLYKEPDIATAYGCFRENNTAYAIMQYSDDQSLDEWMNRMEKVSYQETLSLTYQAITILEKVHKEGLVHGDVDVRSFWLSEDGRLIIKDFAGPFNQPGYDLYRNAGEWLDVRAVAGMMCSLLLKEPMIPEEELVSMVEYERPDVPKQVLSVLRRALSQDPAVRYQTISELKYAIFDDRKTLELVAIPATEEQWKTLRERKKIERRHRQNKIIAAVCVVMATALCVAAVVMIPKVIRFPGHGSTETENVNEESGVLTATNSVAHKWKPASPSDFLATDADEEKENQEAEESRKTEEEKRAAEESRKAEEEKQAAEESRKAAAAEAERQAAAETTVETTEGNHGSVEDTTESSETGTQGENGNSSDTKAEITVQTINPSQEENN